MLSVFDKKNYSKCLVIKVGSLKALAPICFFHVVVLINPLPVLVSGHPHMKYFIMSISG